MNFVIDTIFNPLIHVLKKKCYNKSKLRTVQKKNNSKKEQDFWYYFPYKFRLLAVNKKKQTRVLIQISRGLILFSEFLYLMPR